MDNEITTIKPAKIAIVCFSAISNVAAIVPQLYSLTKRYPMHEFIVISRNFLHPLFASLNNTTFIGADIRGIHSTPKGIFLLLLLGIYGIRLNLVYRAEE